MNRQRRTVAAAEALILARTRGERETAALEMVDALVEADDAAYAAAFKAFSATFPAARAMEPILVALRARSAQREAAQKAAINYTRTVS
jgi:hypothetical protein